MSVLGADDGDPPLASFIHGAAVVDMIYDAGLICEDCLGDASPRDGWFPPVALWTAMFT